MLYKSIYRTEIAQESRAGWTCSAPASMTWRCLADCVRPLPESAAPSHEARS